jgi:hypothetical protein
MQSGYYDMDNNIVIGDNNNSSEVDVLNTTPFSVRDILNIANQNSAEVDSNVIAYHDVSSDLFSQKLYASGANNNNCASNGYSNSTAAQYKR